MKMTERKLRSLIRSIIAEANIVKGDRGNIDLDKRGMLISDNEARRIEHDFKRLPGFKKVKDTDLASLLYQLLAGTQGNTNEVVIDPKNREDFQWAMANSPEALVPLFAFENKDYKESSNIIVFRTIDSSKYYKLRLDGEAFDDLSKADYSINI